MKFIYLIFMLLDNASTLTGQKYFRTKIFPKIFHIKPLIFITFSWSHSLADFHEIFTFNSRIIRVYFMPDFLYHLTTVFTNCSMNIDQLVFKLLEVTLVLVRKRLKILLLMKLLWFYLKLKNCFIRMIIFLSYTW